MTVAVESRALGTGVDRASAGGGMRTSSIGCADGGSAVIGTPAAHEACWPPTAAVCVPLTAHPASLVTTC